MPTLSSTIQITRAKCVLARPIDSSLMIPLQSGIKIVPRFVRDAIAGGFSIRAEVSASVRREALIQLPDPWEDVLRVLAFSTLDQTTCIKREGFRSLVLE